MEVAKIPCPTPSLGVLQSKAKFLFLVEVPCASQKMRLHPKGEEELGKGSVTLSGTSLGPH